MTKLKDPPRRPTLKKEEWTSHWTSRKVVGKTIAEVKKAGFKVKGKSIDWGNLYIYVDYDPNLKACKAYPYFKTKPKYYRHRNKTLKLPPPDLCYTYRSLDDYLKSRISEEHLVIDHNPGAPMYDSRKGVVPISKMSDTKKPHMYITCPYTPKQLVNKALKKIKKLGWKKWSLFVCDVWYGMGGYIVPRNSDHFFAP